MIFKAHYLPANRPHAVLSASKAHWLKYDEDKMARVFVAQLQAAKGNKMHELACALIQMGVSLPDTSATINQYVNDSINFRLTPEQVLWYSDNCYGTADAIGFRNNTLKVSDLKTGITVTTFSQLIVYCALFCLEYGFKPFDIKMEMRIYQNDGVRLEMADPDDVIHAMDKIKTFDVLINEMREEAE